MQVAEALPSLPMNAMSTQSKIRVAVLVGCVATCGFVAPRPCLRRGSLSFDVFAALLVFGVLAVARDEP